MSQVTTLHKLVQMLKRFLYKHWCRVLAIQSVFNELCSFVCSGSSSAAVVVPCINSSGLVTSVSFSLRTFMCSYFRSWRSMRPVNTECMMRCRLEGLYSVIQHLCPCYRNYGHAQRKDICEVTLQYIEDALVSHRISNKCCDGRTGKVSMATRFIAASAGKILIMTGSCGKA
jgi:hypothetical protein